MASEVRILLVDDNIDHVQLAMRQLRGDPAWKVDTARLGSECLQKLDEHPYDLVFLDYRLPDMTGLEVLREARTRAPGAQIVLMSAQGSEEVAQQAIAAGAAGYVVKTGEFGKRLAYEVRERTGAEE